MHIIFKWTEVLVRNKFGKPKYRHKSLQRDSIENSLCFPVYQQFSSRVKGRCIDWLDLSPHGLNRFDFSTKNSNFPCNSFCVFLKSSYIPLIRKLFTVFNSSRVFAIVYCFWCRKNSLWIYTNHCSGCKHFRSSTQTKWIEVSFDLIRRFARKVYTCWTI